MNESKEEIVHVQKKEKTGHKITDILSKELLTFSIGEIK